MKCACCFFQTLHVHAHIATNAKLVHTLLAHLRSENLPSVKVRGRVRWQGNGFAAWIHHTLPTNRAPAPLILLASLAVGFCPCLVSKARVVLLPVGLIVLIVLSICLADVANALIASSLLDSVVSRHLGHLVHPFHLHCGGSLPVRVLYNARVCATIFHTLRYHVG